MPRDAYAMRTLHFGLRVADLDRSLAFYTGLGYRVLGTVPETAFGSLTMIRLPNDDFVTIELVHDHATPPGGNRLNHFVVQVASMADTVERLAAGGIEVEEPSSPDGSTEFLTAWVTDPDGNRIELVQWPPGHADGMTEVDMVG
ncbi:VOC family protein [Asanoa sp. NPDC050611]|uniref:VOC family protein n=1 Tax=Asanoa sp. NPDC050611 TaxID=3157098 RepID=UPI0033EBD8D3